MATKQNYLLLFVSLCAGAVMQRSCHQPSQDANLSSPLVQSQVAAQADDTIQSIRKKAALHYPGKSVAEADQLEAEAEASENLNKTSGDKKKSIAASQFLGYYFANTTVYTDICNGNNVDVHAYVNPFKSEHTDVKQAALDVLAKSSLHVTPAQLDQLFAAQEHSFVPMLTARLQQLATLDHKSSTADGCRMLANHGAEIAGNMIISKTNPPVYGELMPAP